MFPGKFHDNGQKKPLKPQNNNKSFTKFSLFFEFLFFPNALNIELINLF